MNMINNNVTHIANGQRLTSTLELAEVSHGEFAKATEEALEELRMDAPRDDQGNRLLDKLMAFTVATGISTRVALLVAKRMTQLEGEA